MVKLPLTGIASLAVAAEKTEANDTQDFGKSAAGRDALAAVLR